MGRKSPQPILDLEPTHIAVGDIRWRLQRHHVEGAKDWFELSREARRSLFCSAVAKLRRDDDARLDLLVDLTRLLFPLSLCPLLRVTPWQRQNGPADTAIVNIVLAVMS